MLFRERGREGEREGGREGEREGGRGGGGSGADLDEEAVLVHGGVEDSTTDHLSLRVESQQLALLDATHHKVVLVAGVVAH